MAGRRGHSGAAALHLVLHDSNLLEYEPLLMEEGADDVTQLKELDEEEFRQLCLMVGMASKPFHVKRLQKALGRPSTQVYSQKRLDPNNDSSNFSRPPPPNNPAGGIGRMFPTIHNPRIALALSSQQQQLQSQHPVASVTHPAHQQHYMQKLPQQPHRGMHTDSLRAGTFSPDRPSDSAGPAGLGLNPPTKAATSSPKQLFLPHYLHPDSDSKDISPLVDELTPIQAELGPCPFKPSDWDERRSELIRRYAAIYGQGNSKRKNEELSMHEENINVAAFQLCLRDPTLLVRRDELLVLSRKAIKDGGYTFQHGLSKARLPEPTSLAGTSMCKETLEKPQPSLDEETYMAKSVDIGGSSVLPLPRNMSREKKLKRVEELEFLINKNKMKQAIKLTALEKARQGKDFSMINHLQAEIESLGNTLANLQEEYSNMKYRLRRSDRYFEKKQKRDQEMLEVPAVSVSQSPIEAVRKRVRLQTEPGNPSNEQFIGGAVNHQQSFYSAPTTGILQTSASLGTRVALQTSASNSGDQGDHGVTNTSLALSQPCSIVTTATTSLSPLPSSSISHPPPSTSPSLTTSPPALLHVSANSDTLTPPSSHLTSNLVPLFPQHYPENPTTTTTTTSSNYLTTRPTVTAQVVSQLEQQEENTGTAQHEREGSHTMTGVVVEEEEEISSKQLLANINKLATQAAANLRSLPHF